MPKRKKRTSKQALREAMSLVAPGTVIREAIAAILQAHNGALLCIGETKKLVDISEGGVELDCETRPQILYELCKMDGAIILSEDGSRILYANRFMKADSAIPSDETGTRHRAAERVAQKSQCTVVCVSERRATVTLYVQDTKHVMDTIATLLNKASQALQTLEKYVSTLQTSMEDLSAREFQDMVTIFDVCKVVQRCEMVKRIAKEIEPYLLELGDEGRLIDLQVRELMGCVEEADLVVRDYFRERQDLDWMAVRDRIQAIDSKGLLELGTISQALGYGTNLRTVDAYLTPRGYRILAQTHRLSTPMVEALVEQFGSLQAIIRAPSDELCTVEGIGEVLAERIRTSLNLLRSQLALDLGRG